MDQHTETEDPSAARIRALYTPQNNAPPLVQHGQLPKKRKKDAPKGERQARRRLHDLLNPAYQASSEEVRALRDAGILLLERKGGGYHINPQAKRETDDATAQAGVVRALGIAKLYGLEQGYPALVEHGVLPTRKRKDAPDWEKQARRRLHDLLNPATLASSEEEEVLRKAEIPLLPRKGGGYHINPQIKRETDDAIAQAGVVRALGIAKLYGLEQGYPALVEHGVLPTRKRKDAPDWEQQARQRLHSLLNPEYQASTEEVKVLNAARIPLLPRKDGGYYINPGIERQDDEDNAQVRADRALNIAKLYGLIKGIDALVEHGVLAAVHRKGEPPWERQARQRLHDLLRPAALASPAEKKVLEDAGIPLLQRDNGGYHINPQVKREKNRKINRKRAALSAVSALPPAQQPPVPAPVFSPPMTAAHAWPAHPATTANEQALDWHNQNWYPEPPVSLPAGTMTVPDVGPTETLPVLMQGLPHHLSYQQPMSEYPFTADRDAGIYNGEPGHGPWQADSGLPPSTMPSSTDDHPHRYPAHLTAATQYQPYPPDWTASPQPTTTHPHLLAWQPPHPTQHHRQPQKKKH
ncbi:hypothetical protein [Streptomyces sp. NPDC006012]|uniref:hypothetical protein n=1 Tax=Streptomyces sp. NPDC006012 TaxID=3364739 RepID=UPI0036AFF400